MDEETAEEVYPTRDVDWWLESLEPPIELAVAELNRLRKVEQTIRVQMARIEGYVRHKMDLDELDPDPDILKSPYDWEDEDDE